MATFKTVTIEQLDRTIYELLRLSLVSAGNLPDVTTFVNPALYKQACEGIKASGTLIEVYGVGFSENRDLKSSHSMVINRKAVAPTELGGSTDFYEKKQNDKFIKKRSPATSCNVVYEIRNITNSAAVERMMDNIVRYSLGLRKYVTMVGTDDNSVLLTFTGDTMVQATDFFERIFNFTYIEVWLESTVEVLRDDVPQLTEITIKAGIKNEPPPAISKQVVAD